MSASWKSHPDCEGWYFIGHKRDKTVRWNGVWVYIYMLSDDGNEPLAPAIYSDILEDFVDVKRKKYPPKRWFGPVRIDENP